MFGKTYMPLISDNKFCATDVALEGIVFQVFMLTKAEVNVDVTSHYTQRSILLKVYNYFLYLIF
jgi:hypothetical protein